MTKTINLHGCSECGGDHKDLVVTPEQREGYVDGSWMIAVCPETGGELDVEDIMLSSICVIEEEKGTFKLRETFRGGRIWLTRYKDRPYKVEIECQLCGEDQNYLKKTLDDARAMLKNTNPQGTVCIKCAARVVIANAQELDLEHCVEDLEETFDLGFKLDKPI